MASYRELESFATFASDLDDASKKQLARGARLVEILKQGEHQPWAVEDQIVTIYLAISGEYDIVPTEEVRRFESQLIEELHRNVPQVYEQIDGGKELSDESKDTLARAVADFKKIFRLQDGTPLLGEQEELDEDEVTRETLQVKRQASRKV